MKHLDLYSVKLFSGLYTPELLKKTFLLFKDTTCVTVTADIGNECTLSSYKQGTFIFSLFPRVRDTQLTQLDNPGLRSLTNP